MKIIILLTALTIISSCSREYNCEDNSITPVFIKYQAADIDTFIIRKYVLNSNFSNQTDSVIITLGYSGYYITNNDTTVVQLFGERLKIESGFDWQIFIPAKNKVVNITAINSPQTTGKCNTGFFSKLGCACFNPIVSCKLDNQYFAFAAANSYAIYINN
jgi:hypothetical protein